ncbi:SseB family protein [Streptomyces tsukubensis]|uniref:SseB protein N-terminal domain-containing protein n=1 Tax=Streptomyces tsukubensis TaxID=83656 RepID=A0A1V4AF45_9ACTN|nr:SseB family protein [Streptomyces tsukubensis]OON82223.1 hypothetical protein B1H18_04065 [Streptomyces tsukubensis]QFR92712.1 SseB family protein [Streptomyces tsukubensis]
MANKNIPVSGFPDDDGTADPALSAALEVWAKDRHAHGPVLTALLGARLLVPVVAVLDESEVTPEAADGASAEGPGPVPGLRREKTSDMAVPTLKAGGRKALPAFTSTATLARWDRTARPVAVPLRQAIEAAAHEQADTIVLDLAGPVPYEITGAALRALAEGRGTVDPLADPAVLAAVRGAVAGETAVVRAHLGPSSADGTLALVLDENADVQATAGRIARTLAADEVLRVRLVKGLELALLPPEATPPGEPLFTR